MAELGIRRKWRKGAGHTDECELKKFQMPYSNVWDREKYALSQKIAIFGIFILRIQYDGLV